MKDEGIIPPQPPMDLVSRRVLDHPYVKDALRMVGIDTTERTRRIVEACRDITHPEAIPELLAAAADVPHQTPYTDEWVAAIQRLDRAVKAVKP